MCNIKDFFASRRTCQLYIKINNLAVKTPEDKKMFFNLYGNNADHIFIENISP